MTRIDPRVEALRESVLAIYEEHRQRGELPTSSRFIFYELIQRGLWSKVPYDSKRADVRPQQALTYWRQRGAIPWADIVDETRTLDAWETYPTVLEGARPVLGRVRLDPWDGEAPMIITESRSLAGVLRDIAYRYGVPIAATNGQVGGFLHTDLGPALLPGNFVLYLGDLDKAGADIETNTRRALERIVGDLLAWERVAITEEQVREHKIPSETKVDQRHRPPLEYEAWETEALQQGVLQALVTARLDALLQEPLEAVLERERAEQAAVRARLRGD